MKLLADKDLDTIEIFLDDNEYLLSGKAFDEVMAIIKNAKRIEIDELPAWYKHKHDIEDESGNET